MRNNHTRALHEIISIEAWHSSPEDDGAHALHVDVSFRKAKIGDDSEAKVRFTLGIKRADVTFVIPEYEDIRVIQSSVAREASFTGTLEVRATKSQNLDAKVDGQLGIGGKSPVSANLSASTSLSSGATETSTLKGEISSINWKQYKDSLGNYAWEVSAADRGAMLGKPWDAVAQPRLRFRTTPEAKIPPVSRVMARCRREDLSIEGIESKAARGIDLSSRFAKNRMAAAEAVLKMLLERGDLDHSDVNEKFSTILIGETIVSEEVR